MAKRYKTQVRLLSDLDQVNLALREIGRRERELERLDNSYQEQIDALSAKTDAQGREARERILELSAQISAYAEHNRTELFRTSKSVELLFGVFGYRKSTKISVKKTTVALLKKLGVVSCIRVKEEADKKALAALDDATLAQVDAARKVKDQFFCEPNREEINKDLLAAGL